MGAYVLIMLITHMDLIFFMVAVLSIFPHSFSITWKLVTHTLSPLPTGNRLLIRLGDKEVEFNPDFKFYITTKLSNPHYTPEITTKTAIVNFAVKEQGLEAQLLGIVVRKERPELEEQKDKLVVNIAQSKKKLAVLEDEILR